MDPGSGAAAGVPAASRPETEAGRILVVDDNELNRDLLARRLRQQGHAVTTVSEGREALEQIHTGGFDLVLLDVMMPGMDGYQVLGQLHDDGWLYRTPVIMISALSELESVARCIELGATDYLPKPFNPVLLKARVGASLERKRLRDRERLHATSLERDLEMGREIQANFFPQRLPDVPGWEIGVRFQPARQVAGDFYDVFSLDDGRRVGLVLADVCGKGVGAALFMAVFRSLFRSAAAPQEGPRLAAAASGFDSAGMLANAVLRTNDFIARTHSRANMFATVFFGVLQPETGSLVYINGGHESPVVLGPTGVKQRLAPTGPAVGLFPEMVFRVEETVLETGDLLLAFTDGVTEAQNSSGEFFGEERLLALLDEPADTAADLLGRIEANVLAYIGGAERSDDVALLAVRRERAGENGKETA